MMNYNDGKWHGWNGGECPVHPETVVEVVCTNTTGHTFKAERRAGVHLWSDRTHAFRVIKEQKEPREWWAVGSVNYPTIELANNALHAAKARGAFAERITHVREVLE